MGDDESCADLWADVAESRNKSSNRQETTNKHHPNNKCQDSDLRVSTVPSLPSKSYSDIRSAHEARRGPAIGMTPRRSASIGNQDYRNGTHRIVPPHPQNHSSHQQQQQKSQRTRHRAAGQNNQSTGALPMRRADEAKRHSSQFELNKGDGSFQSRDRQSRRISRPNDPNNPESGIPRPPLTRQAHSMPTLQRGGVRLTRIISGAPRHTDRGHFYEEEEQGVQRMESRSPHHHAIEGRSRPSMATRQARSMPDLYEELNDSSHFNGKNIQRGTGVSSGINMSAHSRQSTKSAEPRRSSMSAYSRHPIRSTGTASGISNHSREQSMKSTSRARLPNISINHSPESTSRLSDTPTRHSREALNNGRSVSSASNHSRKSRSRLSSMFNHDARRESTKTATLSRSSNRGQESRRRLLALGSMMFNHSQESTSGRASHGDVQQLVLSQESMRWRSSYGDVRQELELAKEQKTGC